MRTVPRILVVLIWIATLVLACLWALDPENPQYEPITLILVLISSAITAVLAWKPAARWVKSKRRTVHMPSSVGEQLLYEHKQILRSLNENNVEYMLIGGFTGLFYGGVRHTHDLDVWIGHAPDNHQRLKDAIKPLAYDTSLIDGTIAASHSFVRLGQAPIDLYLNESMSGTDFYVFYKRRKVFVVDDLPISVMSQRDKRVQTSYKFDPPQLRKT
jgi:hypothetical protein